jgi:hypothetical protein
VDEAFAINREALQKTHASRMLGDDSVPRTYLFGTVRELEIPLFMRSDVRAHRRPEE